MSSDNPNGILAPISGFFRASDNHSNDTQVISWCDDDEAAQNWRSSPSIVPLSVLLISHRASNVEQSLHFFSKASMTVPARVMSEVIRLHRCGLLRSQDPVTSEGGPS